MFWICQIYLKNITNFVSLEIFFHRFLNNHACTITIKLYKLYKIKNPSMLKKLSIYIYISVNDRNWFKKVYDSF